VLPVGMGRAITQPGLTRTNIILTRYRGDREKDYSDQFKMALDPADMPGRSSLRWTSRHMFGLQR
jgi:hypothetical protein